MSPNPIVTKSNRIIGLEKKKKNIAIIDVIIILIKNHFISFIILSIFKLILYILCKKMRL